MDVCADFFDPRGVQFYISSIDENLPMSFPFHSSAAAAAAA